jgi:hypothetical protein
MSRLSRRNRIVEELNNRIFAEGVEVSEAYDNYVCGEACGVECVFETASCVFEAAGCGGSMFYHRFVIVAEKDVV